MAKQPITMLQIRRILQLLAQGQSKRKISSILHASRHTIDGYALKIEQTGLSLNALSKLSDAELATLLYTSFTDPVPDQRFDGLKERLDYFQKELSRPGVTKLRLWSEYRVEVPEGYGYSQFCEHLVSHNRKSAATMHFEHKPGERLQIDFAGKKLSYVDQSTGEIIACPVLVCVLPFSGYAYVEALQSASQEHLFAAMGRCLSYLGGVPLNALSDNMKQFVHKSSRYEPVFSELCEQWALHYNTTLSAARVRKPKDKPTVENTVNLTYMRVYAPLRHETFYCLKDLNQAILAELDKHHRMLFQKRSYSRLDRYIQEEKPLLCALPDEPFILKHTAMAKVQKNYHVILGEDWHQYSVPYRLIGKQVKIIYDSDEVEIYLGLQRIAVHRRDYRKHGYTTLEEHMPEKHKKYQETKGWDAAFFLRKGKELGDCSFEIMGRILESRTFTEQAYNACIGILRLSDIYGKDRLENACKRAIGAPRVSYRLIDNILTNNLDKQMEDQTELFTTIQDHENLRGPQAYH
jgi:transposase